MLLLVCLAPPALGLPAATLQFGKLTLTGQQESSAVAAAFQLQSAPELGEAALAGHAQRLVVRTENVTAPATAAGGIQPERDGRTDPYQDVNITASATFSDLDVLVVPLEGHEPPRIFTTSSQSTVTTQAIQRVNEVGHVDSDRSLLSSDVRDTLATTANGASHIRIEGDFAISVWSWNFTVQGERSSRYVTGAYRLDPVSDPFTGTQLFWTEYQQVAQIEIQDGWIDIRGVGAAAATTYAATTDISGLGGIVAESVTGKIGSLTADGGQVAADGTYTLTASASSTPELRIKKLVGQLTIDGAPVRLGDSGALRDTSTTARQTTPKWTWLFGIAGLIIVAVVVKGPAQMSRFNRLQERFESKDYIGVLARIDPFTHRRRYRRKANFLKTVSLLSLEEFKEASLFLQTLGPAESPEPATKAFLQACAAAGLGQDDAVLQFLAACFRDDPTYVEEAKTVPALAGYLPYFTLTSREEAAT